MASTNRGHREFPITDEIRELGFSRVRTTGITLLVYNSSDLEIQCRYYKDDLKGNDPKLK